MSRRRTAIGTIDHPLTNDPQARVRTDRNGAAIRPATGPADRTGAAAAASRQNRNREMQLIPEAMARAHLRQRLDEAESQRPGRRLAQARRLQRRAERVSLRARRAIALVVMQ
ncbi:MULTISPECIES: hypothetical protein [Streptomycetaceae]|nr:MULTISPECIES: hypothetical protein [Streptomycetaceae]MYS60922.1 hypothetical protein [Streptomyces sp. SID5468]CCB76750.1 conserved protein of unknown function [Streptantibioticus cattleyicolor NRRL 8057 = DSM 46488]